MPDQQRPLKCLLEEDGSCPAHFMWALRSDQLQRLLLPALFRVVLPTCTTRIQKLCTEKVSWSPIVTYKFLATFLRDERWTGNLNTGILDVQFDRDDYELSLVPSSTTTSEGAEVRMANKWYYKWITGFKGENSILSVDMSVCATGSYKFAFTMNCILVWKVLKACLVTMFVFYFILV